MGESTSIAWCDHTFNPWWGCTRVSPGCAHCYAEAFAKRTGLGWGPRAERRFFGEKHWAEPLKWNRKAAADGVRRRVFCASMADVFEDRPELVEPRVQLWRLIRACPDLDWLLLTKRPENFSAMLPWTDCWSDVCKAGAVDGITCPPDECDLELGGVRADPWPNVWLLVTAEDQLRANERIPILLKTPAVVRGVSYEPALGSVDFRRLLTCQCPGAVYCEHATSAFSPDLYDCARCGHMNGDHCGPKAECSERLLDWLIAGGESGRGNRELDLAWVESVDAQTRAERVPLFVKQDSGPRPGTQGRIPDHIWARKEFPEARRAA